ncbi:MAG: LysR family transcriptional regulator [Boseongicola sp. SB0665_bin_10]|nr:LysR family transcriptional regulator [Boseongicola sp. SB0665_bin_10]
MLDLRDLDCLLALTRHRHFARAASDCGLSQPAFSMRIRQLEDRLGIQIVKRGNRFQGLTAEGETVVAHARAILDRVRTLEEEVRAAKGEVTGALMIGTIPTSSAYAALAANRLRARFPGIRPRIETTNSLAIQQGVDDGRFDAGLTYSEGASTDLLRVERLYDEQYILFAPEHLASPGAGTVTWAEAAEMPLILLEPEMQNRRILDHVFESVGAHPSIVAETSGFIAAIAMAREGMGATVLPQVLVDSLGTLGGAVLLPIIEPEVSKPVALVTPRRSRGIPVVEALRSIVAPTEQ